MGTSASASIMSTETSAVAINGQQRATMQQHQQDHPPSPSAKGSTDGTGGDVDGGDNNVDDDDDSKENALSSALILPMTMTMTIAAATDANANTASSNTNTGKRQRRRDTRCNKGSAAGGAVVPPDDQTTTTTALMPSPGSSCGVRRRTAGGVAVFETDGGIGDGRNKRCKTSKEKDQEDMEWICAECKEAECGLVAVTAEDNGDGDDNGDNGDGFLFCDGPCRRIFHLPCAGLSKPPDGPDGEWLCKDCGNGRHACAYCSEYGQDGVDVFPCGERSSCGLFFHEACLQARNVDYTYSSHALAANDGGSSGPPRSDGDGEDDDDDEEEETPRTPLFTCPAHHCWTCTQKDMIQIEKEEVEKEQRQREEEDDTAAQQNGGTAKKKTQKRRRSKKRDTIFKSKTEARIYRCLYCPIAYHSTCIPPGARFHELAVLCHEHASSHRLPELDLHSSIQSKLEDKVDRTLLRLHGVKRQSNRPKAGGDGFWNQRKTSANPFIPGLWGDRLDSSEQRLLRCIGASASSSAEAAVEIQPPDGPAQPDAEALCLEGGNAAFAAVAVAVAPSGSLSMVLDGSLPFCLPVDVKSEVYSKPPTYVHIQALRYSADREDRPKKIRAAEKNDQERCKCTGPRCGDDCFNRAIMTECGPASCNLGATDCGNRGLTRRQFVKCQPRRERGKGWGLAALEAVPRGRLVHEYVGEVINEKEKTKRLLAWNEDHPNDPNFYVMALSGGYYVDARECANQSRFINHSCAPNCKVVSVNVRGHIRNGIYSIRDIQAGEFLSYDYHFDTKQGDRFVCRCGAPNCRGTMKGGKNDKGDSSTKTPLTWKEAKAGYEADRSFLNELHGTDVRSLVDILLPEAENPNEVISAGPLTKYRDEAQRSRIFLWRNVKLGSDFVSRNSRLEATGKVRGSRFVFQGKEEFA